MIELHTPGERARLKRFYPQPRDTLLLAALEGSTGRCWMDERGASVIVLARGFIFPAGQARADFFREAAEQFPKGFLTISGTPAWLGIARAWGARTLMTRYAMVTPDRFDLETLRKLIGPIPGYTFRIGDESTYQQCLQSLWSEDLASLYTDGEGFAREGLMIAAYAGDQLVGGCGAYARTEDQVEIEISTHPDHRRRGLATACAARFLLNCRGKGLRPHWDAMTKISAALARKLGFLPGLSYRAACRE